MTDGTRNYTKFEEAITRLSVSQAPLMDAQSTVMEQQIARQEDIHSLTAHLNATDSKFEQTLHSFQSESLNQPTNSSSTPVHSLHHQELVIFILPDRWNLTFHFKGTDPLVWILKPLNSLNSIILVTISFLYGWSSLELVSMNASKWPIKFLEWIASLFRTQICSFLVWRSPRHPIQTSSNNFYCGLSISIRAVIKPHLWSFSPDRFELLSFWFKPEIRHKIQALQPRHQHKQSA